MTCVSFLLPGNLQGQESLQQKLETSEKAYLADPSDPDKLIWYGRFLAYANRFEEAIELYKKGSQQFPDDARILRHLGHRYISIRKFDDAIATLEKAAQLVEGAADQVEPDGMPNAQNIPIGTLGTNIWYHLGLAYYLKHDFENSLRCYTKCREVGSNDDNLVSSTYWLYSINRRMGREADAMACLEAITEELNVIENFNYHRICLFYKGLIPLEELATEKGEGAAGSAIDYAIANWHYYNDRRELAKRLFENACAADGNTAFGYIAAEVDLQTAFEK